MLLTTLQCRTLHPKGEDKAWVGKEAGTSLISTCLKSRHPGKSIGLHFQLLECEFVIQPSKSTSSAHLRHGFQVDQVPMKTHIRHIKKICSEKQSSDTSLYEKPKI